MIDPSTLDPEGAWLLDRIAARKCHYYLCARGGTHLVQVVYTFLFGGSKRPVTLVAWQCDGHVSPRAR